MRFSIIALLFVIASASAFNDDPPGTKYYIQNVKTQKFLYMGRKSTLPGGKIVARNAYIWNIPKLIPPINAVHAQFSVSQNNAIGPYYVIENVGCSCTLFGSEYTVAPELNNSVNIVMGWENGLNANTPEASWNIRHFNDKLYILNVHYGAYLYAADTMTSPTSVDRNKKYAVLMPSDTAGRVPGTEWQLIAVDDQGMGSMLGSHGPPMEGEGDTLNADEEKDSDGEGVGEKDGEGEGVGEKDGEEEGFEEKGEDEEVGEEAGEGEEGEEKDGEEKFEEDKENGNERDELIENNEPLEKDSPDVNERKMTGEEVVEDKTDNTQIVEVGKEEEKKYAPIASNEKGEEKKVEREREETGKVGWEKEEIDEEKKEGEQAKEKNGTLVQKNVTEGKEEEKVDIEQEVHKTDRPEQTDKMQVEEKYGEVQVLGGKLDQKKVEEKKGEFAEKNTMVTVEQDDKEKKKQNLERDGKVEVENEKPVEIDLTLVFEKDATERVEGGKGEQSEMVEKKDEPLETDFGRNDKKKMEEEEIDQGKVDVKEEPLGGSTKEGETLLAGTKTSRLKK